MIDMRPAMGVDGIAGNIIYSYIWAAGYRLLALGLINSAGVLTAPEPVFRIRVPFFGGFLCGPLVFIVRSSVRCRINAFVFALRHSTTG